MTKACKLKCKHCRAEAIPEPLPGELTTQEGFKLIDDITKFGKPYPVLILTGGDPMMRADLEEILAYARDVGVKVGVAPAVTDLLLSRLEVLRRYGVKYISISVDGFGKTHDKVRGVEGHFEETVDLMKSLKGDWILQVNTLVSKETVYDLPKVVKLLKELSVNVWELFFLVKVGRGTELEELTPKENEDVSHFLFEVSRYGLEVRTVEAPFFRRVYLTRLRDGVEDFDEVARRYGLGQLYRDLSEELEALLGPPGTPRKLGSAFTRDGYGIIFVSYDGQVYPSGFAPFNLGNVREESLVEIYRNHPTLRKIRAAEFKGRCGICEFREVCGGSRARALAAGDILGEDPGCSYVPDGFYR